jgi:hypothetical protein
MHSVAGFGCAVAGGHPIAANISQRIIVVVRPPKPDQRGSNGIIPSEADSITFHEKDFQL